jgi:transcription initiation factor TFIIIB Brf1 subunit/transcription initiation factor TFIIB
MDPELEKAKQLLIEYLRKTPKEELNRIADELILKHKGSPKVEEYLNEVKNLGLTQGEQG